MRGSFEPCGVASRDSFRNGLLLQVSGIGVVRDSVFTGMQNIGVAATVGPPGTQAELNLESCRIAHNASTGVYSSGRNGGLATLRIFNCTIRQPSASACSRPRAASSSRGAHNTIRGNGTDVAGTLGKYLPK